VKRGVFDILRRGFDNTIANWQLSLLRFLEAFVFMLIAVAAIVAIVLPIALSFGIDAMDLNTPEDVAGAIAALGAKWLMLLWVFLGVAVMLTLFLLVHSFVVAGCARVFVDGDRVAGPALDGPRARYRAFTFERWFAGAKAGWWRVFWIYNVIMAVLGLFLLIPLVPTLIALFFLRGASEGPIIMTSCLGLAATMVLGFFVMIVGIIWSNRAIVAWTVHRGGAIESVETGWAAIRADLGRHLLAAIALFVVTMAGSAFFASFSFFAGIGEAMGSRNSAFMVMTLPLRFLGSLLNSAFSAAIGSWFVATYAAIATDPHK
jgi:hypothetical protein